MRFVTLVAGLVACTGSACRAPSSAAPAQTPRARWSYEPDLPVSRPPFDTIHANFKERLEQPYVFIDVRGSYTGTGRQLAELVSRMRTFGIEPSGPPFGLYFDDPGSTPTDQLHSRACIPVERPPATNSRLEYDVLPRANVVYAVIGGAYPEVPRAYPGLHAYMQRMGWVENGPVREIYLVPPSSVRDFAELLCEVQIPAAPRP